MPFLLVALILSAQDAEPVGVARIQRDAEALAPMVTTGLAREFLKASSTLPAVRPRTLYFDPETKTYMTEQATGKLDAGRARQADESAG